MFPYGTALLTVAQTAVVIILVLFRFVLVSLRRGMEIVTSQNLNYRYIAFISSTEERNDYVDSCGADVHCFSFIGLLQSY
jgi:hypothetical protein